MLIKFRQFNITLSLLGEKEFFYGVNMKKSSLESKIQGVVFFDVPRCSDDRGWLFELFRHDELESAVHPKMTYVSTTLPGIMRGPHEHKDQTDFFVFVGPGKFKLYLWGSKEEFPDRVESFNVGESNPTAVIVPPGVIHAYENVSDTPGVVFNAPNSLYAGPARLYPVDEIRWEDNERFIKWKNVRK